MMDVNVSIQKARRCQPKGDKIMLYLIQKDRRFGFIDEAGRIVIEPVFEQILGSFDEGLCPFASNGKCGFIDITGVVRVEPEYDEVTPFFSEIACVRKGDRWGYIGRNGEVLIPFLFEDATGFDENGLAIVEKGGKQGYINKGGNFVIEPKFESAFFFNGRLAKVILDGKIGYIDLKGQMVWIEDVATGAEW